MIRDTPYVGGQGGYITFTDAQLTSAEGVKGSLEAKCQFAVLIVRVADGNADCHSDWGDLHRCPVWLMPGLSLV